MVYVPKNAKGTEDADSFSSVSPFSSERVFERPIVEIANFSLPGFLEHDDNPEGAGTGAPEYAEIAASSICGVLFAASTDTHGFRWRLPMDIDLSKDIDFRLHWSNSAAAATGSCLWAVTYLPIVHGTTTIAAPATALDTVVASDVDLGANIMATTEWGSLTGGTLTTVTPGDDSLGIEITATLTTITDATLSAVDARYYRKYLA